jgi:hypothetical protein
LCMIIFISLTVFYAFLLEFVVASEGTMLPTWLSWGRWDSWIIRFV